MKAGTTGVLLVGFMAGAVTGFLVGRGNHVNSPEGRSFDPEIDGIVARLTDCIARLELLHDMNSRIAEGPNAERDEVVGTSRQDEDGISAVERRLAALEDSVARLVQVLESDLVEDLTAVPTQHGLLESLGARLSMGEDETRRVNVEHFRWSKNQVFRRYGLPDSPGDSGWTYELESASSGSRRVLGFDFDDGFVKSVDVWQSPQ